MESIAEGGDNRVGLHFCPFLRALGKTITVLDHYVNYPEKTKIVTERQTYLRSRPLDSDTYDYDKQDDNNKTPIVVGCLPYGPTYRIIDPAKPLFFYIFQNVMQESFS